MIVIKDKIFIDIKIDGKSLDGPNLVSSILMLEGTPVTAPSIKMVLVDHGGMLTKDLCLTDANEITVTVGKTPDDIKTITRKYRSFNVNQQHGPDGPVLVVLGVYNAPKYTMAAARDSYEGTSSQVLKQLSASCGLDYDGPESFNGRTMDDSQVWLNVAKSRASFAQHMVAKHAYQDDYSAMSAALTSLGVLRYRNLMDVISTPVDEIKYMFALNIMPGEEDKSAREVYIVNKTKEFSQAGVMNNLHNYGSVQVSDGVSGQTAVEEKLDVKTSAPFLAINGTVSEEIGQATRLSYGLLDCGNVHAKYYRAEYQNVRQLALFTERLSVIVDVPTEVQLYDPVIYAQGQNYEARAVRNTDVYVVVGKTLFVQKGSIYGERIELVRMSITEKGEAELKAAEPTLARESSVPEVTLDPTATVAANTLPKARGILGITAAIESKAKALRETAGRTIKNLTNSQPSLTKIAMNAKTYRDNLQQAAKDVKSVAASAKQVKEDAERMQRAAKEMRDGIRDGNIQMIAAGASSIAQSAAYFRPDGVVGNLCATIGVTQALQTTASMYNTVAEQFAGMRNAVDAVTGIGSEVDSVVSDMRAVASSYTDVVGDIAGSYNSVIEAVSGSAKPLNIPNLEINRTNFEGMMRDSVTPISAPMSQVAYTVPTIADVQRDLGRTILNKDDTRNYAWVPEGNYVVPKVTVDELPRVMNDLSDQIENAGRQYEDNQYALGNNG